MAAEELDRLRARLARVDERLRKNVGRRLDLARKIGAAKRRAQLPIRAPTVERMVVGRWQDGLEELGIPPDRALLLARWLVDEAVRVQEEGGPRTPVAPRRLLVIGGAGAMGRWLCGFARTMGHDVRILDPYADASTGFPRVRSIEEGAEWAELIALATPIRGTGRLLERLYATGTEATIFDILSVKAPIAHSLQRGVDLGRHVASVHPLFGPKVRPLSGHNLLVLDCGDPAATAAAYELFRPSSLSVSVLPLSAHDLLMADLQTLPRFVSLLFAAALTRAGRRRQELAATETPSFRRQAEAARSVLSENPDLSLALVASNPSAGAILDRLARGLSELRDTVRRPRAGAYRATLARGRRLLDPSSDGAPGRSSRRSPARESRRGVTVRRRRSGMRSPSRGAGGRR